MKKIFIIKLKIRKLRIYVSNKTLQPMKSSYLPMNSKRRRAFKNELYERADRRCQICGKTLTYSETQLHHVVPKSMGRNNSCDNIICVCDDCHKEIHSNPIIYADMIAKKMAEGKDVIKTFQETKYVPTMRKYGCCFFNISISH